MSEENKMEEFISYVENMTVLELSKLVKALEERLGVSAAAPVAVAAAPAAGAAAPAAEEKTDFDVILNSSKLSKNASVSALLLPSLLLLLLLLLQVLPLLLKKKPILTSSSNPLATTKLLSSKKSALSPVSVSKKLKTSLKAHPNPSKKALPKKKLKKSKLSSKAPVLLSNSSKFISAA